MNFILNINKPAGWTSFDVVAKLRGILKVKRIGHTGTLDPDATGVLPICVGKATKLVELLTADTKEYAATMKLGITTDTQDASGSVLETHSTDGVTEDDVRRVIAGFIGEIQQIPPMYSAVKVDGKRLYELARQGKEVERKPRTVSLHNIIIVNINLGAGEIELKIECSKGTYIRTLCADIGEKLGCGAHMKSLVRTRSGSFKIEQTLTIEDIAEMCKADELHMVATRMDTSFAEYDCVIIAEGDVLRLKNGRNVKMAGRDDGSRCRIYDEAQNFLAVGTVFDGMLVDIKRFY